MKVEEALKTLYDRDLYDLTSEGYGEALRRLRKRDPKVAQRVERALAPVLPRLFPRSRRAWQDTSEGTRARLALLPENPHIQRDVTGVRRVLGIPDGHVRASQSDPLWKSIQGRVKPGAERQVVEGNRAGWWISLHGDTARGSTLEPIEYEMLPAQMQESAMASAGVRFAETDCPDWLRRPPNGPEPYNESAVPIEWAAGRLVERHRLPWKMASPISFYILTLDSSWITIQEPLPLEVCVDHDSPSDLDAFTVIIRGIDEFITKDDWDRVWERYIRWRQDNIWRQRGMKPQGRRAVDIDRLKRAMPVYQQMVKKEFKEFSVKKILDEPCADLGEAVNLDQETLRRAMREVNLLLKPMP